MKRAKSASAKDGSSVLAAPPKPRACGQPLRILVVADNAPTRQLLDMIFVKRGYAVEHAESATGAAQMLRENPFDMMLVDAVLPERDALRMLSFLDAQQVSLVAITTFPAMAHYHQGLEDGTLTYPRDPASLDRLFASVSDAATKQRLLAENAWLCEIARHERIECRLPRGVLRACDNRYRFLYDNSPVMLFTVDPLGTIRSVNGFGAKALGYQVEELVGQPFTSIEVTEPGVKISEQLSACLDNPTAVRRWEAEKQRKCGTRFWVKETARAVTDVDQQTSILIVCQDITEAHQLSQQLSYDASHDALTGLVNRREFEHRLQRVLDTARTDRSAHALCYLDLDRFKQINDTCGHMAGDALLRQLAAVLVSRVRKRDTLARLGGDEFAVLMERCSLAQATRVANVLRTTVERFRFVWEGQTFKIGASIGLVGITAERRSAAEVLNAGDLACYAAKREGRNRIHIHDAEAGSGQYRRDDNQWIARIQQALRENRFRLDLQPIVRIDGASGAPMRYELFLRMEDEEGALIPPGAFLPAAERHNLSALVDRWVIATTFAWLASHRSTLEDSQLYLINLSGPSLADTNFIDFVRGQFQAMSIPPDRICFEISETAAIANMVDTARLISALQKIGCLFALDNFGAGLFSFAYLRSLPVDIVKIDGTFVRGIVHDPVDREVVQAINAIGHVLGKQTIASSVENQAILGELKQIGVNYAQGYGIAWPRPIAAIKRCQAPELLP